MGVNMEIWMPNPPAGVKYPPGAVQQLAEEWTLLPWPAHAVIQAMDSWGSVDELTRGVSANLSSASMRELRRIFENTEVRERWKAWASEDRRTLSNRDAPIVMGLAVLGTIEVGVTHQATKQREAWIRSHRARERRALEAEKARVEAERQRQAKLAQAQATRTHASPQTAQPPIARPVLSPIDDIAVDFSKLGSIASTAPTVPPNHGI